MNVCLCDATIRDSTRIADIYLSSRKQFLPYAPLVHTDAEVRDWIAESLIPSGGVTIAVTGNDILGFMAVSKGEAHNWLDHLYIDPAVTGRGIGTLFIQRAKELLSSPIRLYAFQENIRARRFYMRHGFREIELTDGIANEEKIPDVLMEWRTTAK